MCYHSLQMLRYFFRVSDGAYGALSLLAFVFAGVFVAVFALGRAWFHCSFERHHDIRFSCGGCCGRDGPGYHIFLTMFDLYSPCLSMSHDLSTCLAICERLLLGVDGFGHCRSVLR